jgi:hypothetical protein
MEFLGDMGHVESRFSLFGDRVSVGARWVHYLRQMYHRLQKSFWTHPRKPIGEVGHEESRFGPFGDSVSVSISAR